MSSCISIKHSLNLIPTAAFWENFRRCVDEFFSGGWYGGLDLLDSDERDDLFLSACGASASVWDSVDEGEWYHIATSEECLAGNPGAISMLLQSLMSSAEVERGLRGLVRSSGETVTPLIYHRLRLLYQVADCAAIDLSPRWTGAWCSLQNEDIPALVEQTLKHFETDYLRLSHAGIKVVEVGARSSVMDDPDSFARGALAFTPVGQKNAPLSWEATPCALDVWVRALREVLGGLLFRDAEPEVLARQAALLDRLEVVALACRPTSPAITKLEGSFSITCCGSDQWLIESVDRLCVLQVFQWC